MLLSNFFNCRKTQARSRGLRRDVGLERMLKNLIGKARTVVGNIQFHAFDIARLVRLDRSPNADHQFVFIRYLTKLILIRFNRRNSRLKE